jgi:hypothetical protein
MGKMGTVGKMRNCGSEQIVRKVGTVENERY